MVIRVYLADESDHFRDGLRTLLGERDDIEVVGSSASGQQAVTEVRALRPDVVVVDISMRCANGVDAAACILGSTPSARVVVLGTHATTEHVFRALSAGARGYLLKSSAGAEAADAVRAVHAGRRFVSHRLADMLAEEYLRSAASGHVGIRCGEAVEHFTFSSRAFPTDPRPPGD
jgi:DNA-binding NarL/FixJ family response regulator